MQVKKIMNQVFQSLRGEFELEESYSGRAVLGTIMNTIKVRPAGGCFTEVGTLWLKGLLRNHKSKRYLRPLLKDQDKWNDSHLERRGQRPVRRKQAFYLHEQVCCQGAKSRSVCCFPVDERLLLLGF